jgi:hypothetical protein
MLETRIREPSSDQDRAFPCVARRLIVAELCRPIPVMKPTRTHNNNRAYLVLVVEDDGSGHWLPSGLDERGRCAAADPLRTAGLIGDCP